MHLDPAYISELQQQYPGLDSVPPEYLGTALMVMAVVTIVIGLLQCFLGYKLMKLCLSILGFFLGGAIGMVACAAAELDSLVIVGVVTVVVAILGAILMYKLYRFGVFLLDGILAFLLCMLVLTSVRGAPEDLSMLLLISAIAGIVVGVLGVIFIRPITILVTSITGGMQAGHGIIALVLGSVDSVWGVVAGAALALLGLIVQFKTTKDPDKAEKRKEKKKNQQRAKGSPPAPVPPEPAPPAPAPAEPKAPAPEEDTEG